MRRLFVARHGEYDRDSGALTDRGKEQSRRIAAGLEIGIILSSTRPRALETARIVRGELKCGVPLVRSDYATMVGERPEPVRDLHAFVGRVLAECEVDDLGTDVLLVTHLPLVRALTDMEEPPTGAHQVPNGWRNPVYIPDFKYLIDQPLLWGR